MGWRFGIVLMALLLCACGVVEPPTPFAPPTPTPVPPTPTPVPSRPEDVANAFFANWQQGKYDAMYDLLSADAQAGTPRDVFNRRYSNIHDGIGETAVAVQAGNFDAATSQLAFHITRSLGIYGDVSEDNFLPLTQDGDNWKVAWTPSVIFNGLTASSTVRVLPDVPTRGRILDRNGKPLADNGSILAIGVVPGEVKDEAALLAGLSDALGIPSATIKQRYQGGQPTWFMPIVTRPESDRPDLESKVGHIPGVSLQDRPARVYPLGPAAAHLIGYVAHPTADELRKLAPNGYDDTDWIGRTGVEAWAEQRLAGARGGLIQIADSSGRVVKNIARKAATPGEDVTLSIDSRVQQEALKDLGDKTGSVVIMDPRDNSVLAMASQPSFDPNQFVIGITDDQWAQLNGPDRPMVFRATESAYPTGSIFKVITMAAGIEQAGYKTTDRFDCGLDWNGLPGVTLHNWEAQGTLNLVQALTESCNPAFYEIGLKLDQKDPTILPGYARRFGLGAATGLAGVSEVSGTLPDPDWKQQQIHEPWSSGDSVNLAIGQGYLLATPVQMANAYSALANGTLLTPTLTPGDKPKAIGDLKLQSATYAAILQGMKAVTSTPAGTAAYAFQGEKLPIAAKTGSAENENPDAHAWFVGYTPTDKPTLLVLVMIEGGQHGGTVAAPIGRQLIDFAYPLSANAQH